MKFPQCDTYSKLCSLDHWKAVIIEIYLSWHYKEEYILHEYITVGVQGNPTNIIAVNVKVEDYPCQLCDLGSMSIQFV